MRVPEEDIAFDDLVRGPVRFAAAHVPDYVIVRSNGEPLYTLVNPLDDSLMEITHVLRGEDLLPSTPRQIVLYDALSQIGVGSGRTPAFGHLPTVLGEGNRRLSKRDKGSGLAEYQQKGYLPEALRNYLALLGWAIAEERDVFAIDWRWHRDVPQVAGQEVGVVTDDLAWIEDVIRIEDLLHFPKHVGQGTILPANERRAAQSVGMLAADRSAHVNDFLIKVTCKLRHPAHVRWIRQIHKGAQMKLPMPCMTE
jgi:glutamyl/glutaminyl-tRNA synthetase